jgi:NTE family protein
VYNLLSKLTLHVSNVSDFDKLPIPFFCIATNIETGEAVMLDKGNLAKAITASGAFPSLFQPVIIDNKLLIDGGVINNYPIDELRAKGMDIIIGVDVQDGLASREELITAPDILLQINNYRTINEMKKKSLKTDIYIKPDITDFTVVSFSEGQKIIKNGIASALLKVDELDKLPKTSKDFRREVTITTTDSISIKSINFNGNERYTRAYILGKLKFKPNTTLSYVDFNEGINNLVATNNFDTFQYELQKADDGESYNMTATIKESKITTFIKLGIHYDDLYKSAALVNFTKKRLLFDNDAVSFDFILGDNVRYNFEYFIDKGFYWSIGLKSRFNQFHRNVFAQVFLDDTQQDLTGLNKIDVELQDQTNQLYFQTRFRKDFALSLGAEHKRLKIKSETLLDTDINDEFIFDNTDYLSVYGTLKLDTYDNKYYPTNGFYFNGDFHWYVASSKFNSSFEPFSIAKAEIGYAFSLSERLSANITAEGGFKLGDNTTPYLDFAIGGYGQNFINNFSSFYGYDYVSLTGNSFVKSTFNFDYELFNKNHIMLAANFANIEDNLFDTGEWIKKIDYRGYAIGYGLETFIGPLEARYTYSPELKQSLWFFNLGFWF